MEDLGLYQTLKYYMEHIKIGIVEDDLFTAGCLQSILQELRYTVCAPCKNYDEAILMLESEKPDLVILDIQLENDKDGINVAEYIAANFDIPFIFHSGSYDEITVQRVKKVRPHAFLTKPFQRTDLLIAIENAVNNYNIRTTSKPDFAIEENLVNDSFFVKDAQYFHKIKFDDVLYIESDGAYITLVTEKKKHLLRGSIQLYLEKMKSYKFFRVHRSYAVNLDKIQYINSSYLTIKDHNIPISKNFRENLLALLNIV